MVDANMPTADMQRRATLGLPNGSVRALLTLLVVAVVIVETARGRQVELLWIETLMIALAHYFTSRRFIDLPPAVVQRLEQEGHLELEANPLYLPSYSIRIIIVLAFVVLGIYLYLENRLLDAQALAILGTVFAYVLGMVIAALRAWWNQGVKSSGAIWWDDLKAIVVLLVLAITAAAYFLDMANVIPSQLRLAVLALVLFYFGSR
jgi:hypothetical protein